MFVAGGSFAKVFKVDETTALKRPEAELRNKSTLVIREWLVSRSIDHPNVMCYKKLATNLDITMELYFIHLLLLSKTAEMGSGPR